MGDTEIIDKMQGFRFLSENSKTHYTNRWRKNMRLVKGFFPDDELTKSKVRKRSKIFFRKIWSNNWRMAASFYQAFLKDLDAFDIEPRDTIADYEKSIVLKELVKYRRDRMIRHDDLFLNLLFGFLDILDLGWAPGKMPWEYNEKTGFDGPRYLAYPVEQVHPDFMAATPKKMRFCGWDNYLDKDQLEEYGFKNIEKAQPCGIPNDPVRSARFEGEPDPLQNPGKNEYPKPGRYDDGEKENFDKLYMATEWFYYEDSVWKYCVVNGSNCVLKKPEESVYGKIPGVFGQCLLQAHKLIGEGFPQVLEGPQESYNANLNQRKDNIALSLNPMKHVSRYGNVDLASLVNSRAGGVVLMDDIGAVEDTKPPDVTQSSYVEADSDERMMNDMSGVTPQRLGMGEEQKATVAQINYAESNAKIDLFTAIVGKTFMEEFYVNLTELIIKFETDENIFRVTNNKLIREELIESPVYDVDIDADLIFEAGAGTAGKEIEFRQNLNAIDRANQHNAAMVAMLEKGISPPEGIRMVDTTGFFEDSLKILGRKNFRKYFFMAAPPPQDQGGQDPALAGRNQPQIGGIPKIGGGIPRIDNGSEGGAFGI